MNASANPPPSVNQQVATGMIWGVGGALFYQFVALFVQTALTYFLTKDDYGSYAKAFALLSFAMLVQQLGFNEVLLRKRERLQRWLGSAFWLAILLGLLGSLCLLAAAAPIGAFYDDRQLTRLLMLAAPLPLVRSLCIVPSALLVAAMRFRIHYGLMLLNGLAISMLTLILAGRDCGAQSFPIAMLIAEPLTALVIWRSARPRLGVRWNSRRGRGLLLARWRSLLADLRFTLGGNLSRWLRSGTDALLLGAFAAPAVVGVYFFAQSLVVQIVRVTTLNLSGVLLPALNRLGDDPQRQAQAFMQAARALMFIGAPLCIGLGAIGPLFVRVFLDADKWHDLPPVLAVLASGMVFRLLDEPINALISAQGRFRVGFRISVGAGLTYAAVCFIGASTGTAIGTAISVAMFFSCAGPAMLFVAIRNNGGTLTAAIRVFVIPAALACVSILPWLLLDTVTPGSGRARDVSMLIATVAGAALTYLALACLVRPPGWVQLLERLQAMMPQRLRPVVAYLAGGS